MILHELIQFDSLGVNGLIGINMVGQQESWIGMILLELIQFGLLGLNTALAGQEDTIWVWKKWQIKEEIIVAYMKCA